MIKKLLFLLSVVVCGALNLRGQTYTITNGTINSCTGTVYDPGGASGNYGNSQNFTFTICSGNGQPIYLQFSQFNLENNWDYVYLYNGPNATSPALGTFTGTNSPGTVTASSGCITIRFTSDGSVTLAGFAASIGCGTPPPPPPPPPAPSGNCAGAQPFCTGTTYTFPASTGTTAQTGPNYGCLFTQPNPVWYYLQIANSGNLTIPMSSSPAVDIDFALWGPFTTLTNVCNQLTGTPISCSYSTASTETATIPNAVTGQFYVLVITNFSNQPTNITFNQSGGNGSTNCAILCNINSITATPGACVPATNTYSVTGTLSTFAPPTTGTLTITSSCGGSVTYNPPFSSTFNYTVPNIPANGAACTITASYSADPQCTRTITYTAPASCSSCSLTASNTGPICTNQSITLNATAVTGATSYTWTGPTGANVGSGQSITLNNLTSGGTYTVTVTTANATCTATTNVIVNTLPTPTVSTNSPVCAGNSLNLTATGGGTYAWTGPNGFTSNVANPNIPSVTTAASGTYSVTVTNNGCSATATTNVTINPIPTPTATNNGPICAGATLNLTATGGGTYAWTGPNGFTSNASNPNIPSSTTAASGTYTVTVTNNGCTATATTNVTINPLPTPSASNNGPICAGATLNLTATGGGTYAWTGPNGFTSNIANPNIPSSSTAASGSYVVTVTSAAGCIATATTNVTINALPIPTASNDGPKCEGAQICFTATGGTSYAWTGPNGFTSSTSGPCINNIAPANAGVYTVTVTDANGCTATANSTLNLFIPPGVTVTNSGPICEGNTLNLTGTGGVTYSWTGPNGFTSNISNPTINNATPNATGTYSVSILDANGCSATATTDVVVDPLPIPNASNDGPLCEGATLNLTATGGGTYAWTGPNGFNSILSTPSIPSTTPTVSGTYSVTVTSAAGCTATATTIVTVNPLPQPTASNNGPICEGNTLDLTATGGASYAWTGPNGFTSNISNPTIPSTTVSASGSYSVIVTSAAGCSASASTSVTINPLPQPTASNDGPVCDGSTFNLSASGGGTYSWSGPNGFTSNVADPNIQNATTNASGSYVVTVSSAAGCTATATTVVIVNPLPQPTASNDGPKCEGSQICFTATGGISYSWTGPNGFNSVIAAPCITNISPADSGLYTVTVTDANGCSASASSTLIMFIPPGVTATNNGPLCDGETLNLTATGGVNYSWTGPNSFTSIISTPTINNATPNESGTYSVLVTDANGCSATVNTTVTVNSLPIITATNNGPLCEGSSLNLTATGGGSYSWSGPNGYTSNISSPVISPSSVSASGVYTLIVTSAAGCSTTTTTNVIINPLPQPLASNDGPKCEGSSVTFSATNGTSYTWTGPNGFTSISSSPSINNLSASNAGIYSVSVVDANGCTASSTTNLIVNPLPIADFTYLPTCQYSCTPFTSSSSVSSGSITNYFWDFGDGSGTNNQPSACYSYSTCGNFNVTLVTTTDGGCVDVETKPIQVLCVPVSSFTTSNVCQYTAANFTNNSTGAGIINYVWDFDTQNNIITSDQITSNLNPGTTNNYSAPGTYNVTLIANINGCTDTSNQTITIYPIPSASFTASNVCQGIATSFADNSSVSAPSNITTYNWDYQYNGVFLADATTNSGSSNFTYPTTYSGLSALVVTTNHGCSDTATFNVDVNSIPNADFSFTNVCLGLSNQFSSTSSNTAGAITQSLWDFNYPSTATASGINVSNTYPSDGSYSVELLVISANGCRDSVVKNVQVYPIPVASFSSDIQEGCEPTCITFNSSSSISTGTISGYNWTFADGNNSNSNPATNCFMNDGNYSITLQVTSNQGCQHSATLSNYITIHPRPRAAFGFSPPTTTILNPSISFIDSSMLSVYTSWSFGDGSPLADDLDDYFTHTYQDTGSFIVTQTVISQFGCIDSVKQVIRVEPEWTIFIPSAFTPNGDGKNERFMAAGMGVKDFEMRIFDRWGNILSVINEFKDGAGWDGKDSSTNIECPQGVYVYEINLSDIKNKKHKYVGKVVLLK